MDSRVVQSDQVQDNDEHHPLTHGTDTEEQHYDQEKKSVLNKVKARAKKIKDTIKRHGHHVLDRGHESNNEDQHSPDGNDLDEDEEMVKNSEVHGAPSYGSEVKNTTPTSEQVENSEKSGIKYGGTTAIGKEPHQNSPIVGISSTTELDQNIVTDPVKTFSVEEKTGQSNVNLERPKDLEENTGAPEAYTSPNYQTKDTYPSGGGSDEIDIKPVEQSYGRMNVQDDPKPTPEPNVNRNPEITFATGQTFDTITTKVEEQPQYEPEETKPKQSSYTDKTTYAIADEAVPVSAKNAEASKLGYGEKGDIHEVQGAPRFESDVKNGIPRSEQVENSEKSGIDFGGTTVKGEEPHKNPSTLGVSTITEVDQNKVTEPVKTFSGEEKPGQCNVNLERPIDLEENTCAPEAYTSPNYQTKDTDPSGAGSDEIEMKPVEQSFGRMNVQDEPKPTQEPNANRNPEISLATGQTLDTITTKVEEQPQYESVETRSPNQSSYTDKTAYAIVDEAVPVSAKNAETSKLGYGDKGDIYEEKPENVGLYSTTEIDHDIATDPAKTFSREEKPGLCRVNLETRTGLEEDPHTQGSRPETYTPNHQTNVADPSGAGSDEIDIIPVEQSFGRMNVKDEPTPTTEPNILPTAAETEFPPAGSCDQFAPETISTNINRNPEIPLATGQTFNNNTTTVEEQPQYESVERQPNQSSHTDKTSSAITEETVSAENTAASKLGHEEKGDIHEEEQPKNGNATNITGSTAESGKNIAQSLTQKLAPVYEKVAGVGSAVKSKVSGTNTSGAGTETRNGVSVKDYLAEKLRPGEEDKALSEVITEALHKGKEEPDEKSEKVSEESSVNSTGKGVVGKLKGVVGSWFGKSEENQSSQVAGGEDLSKNAKSGAEVEQVSQVVDETRKQE